MKNREIYPKDPSIRKLVNEGVASVNDEQTASLEIKGGRVAAWDWAPGKLRVDLDQAAMLKLVLGLRSFSECADVQGLGEAAAAREVCNALFPRQAAGSGVWG